ncbi:MAG: 2-oxoacid:acceptor oxidoreductase subunit alpha [Candidatus Lokiarchaeota archaeon]|nr:2-oxoacid:acceptor oxidoreductase subunit alpha [Candidatus Lokiarchaeota archaeon]
MKSEKNLVLAGAAGMGIQTVESLFVNAAKQSGLFVFASREYMSRVRGGINSTAMRISSRPVRAFKERIDLLIPLSDLAIPHLKQRIRKNTIILGEKAFLNADPTVKFTSIEVPFTDMATKIGNKIYANIIALGILAYIFKVNKTIVLGLIAEQFWKKGDKIIEENQNAIEKGYEMGKKLELTNPILKNFEITKNPQIINDLILDGTQAIGLGAIAGGCNYETFYPMAPSTGIGTFLAQNALKFGIIVDQSEDEISVINKALGASFAGARSLVTTSGGGFSLMSEGISLAGIMELPIVIVVGMRPGPATGMPTRTSQEDLELILHAGAGFFPRIIFSPGTIEDAFYLTQQAFNLTQEFQVPVFILTDQYLVDSYYNLPSLDLEKLKIEKHIVKTVDNYNRYVFAVSSISPRGIPGYGNGLVNADSHTHDEQGTITEDPVLRSRMVKKRLHKLELIQKASILPEFIGNRNKYKILVVSWGSNYYLIKEALEIINREDIGFLHFKQVYPLHAMQIIQYLNKANLIIAVEQNPTGQFAELLEKETHIPIDCRILKFSGYTFSVEELVEEIIHHVDKGAR